MITGEALSEEAKKFFLKCHYKIKGNKKSVIEDYALEYIQKYARDKFRYKDIVEAGVLVDRLIELRYVSEEIEPFVSNKLKITKEGREFIERQ